MRRTVSGLVLFSLLLSLWAGGCSLRPESVRETAAEEPSSAAAVAVRAPASAPTPTPEPVATSCPHLHWEDGVCTECGLACVHAAWEDGRCRTCGLVCPHAEHNGSTRRCTQCGELVLHTYVKNVCTLCGRSPVFETKNVPRELFKPCEHKGSLEKLSYETEVYTPTTSKEPVVYKKDMVVYLPYGYDPAEKYDLLILLHGSGCTEEYWLKEEHDYSAVKLDVVYTTDLLDNLMDRGLSRRVIVAAPTFYKDELGINNYNRALDEGRFLRELREDILPLLEEKYSLWTGGEDGEDAAEARRHRAFAGLSMGSIYAYTGTLTECLDLFGWYGCFSGSDGYMDQIAAALNAPANADKPIYYFYNSIGTKDMYYYLHTGQYKELISLTKGLTDGENAAMTEVKDAGHEYCAWSTGLYNFLGVAFSLPEE